MTVTPPRNQFSRELSTTLGCCPPESGGYIAQPGKRPESGPTRARAALRRHYGNYSSDVLHKILSDFATPTRWPRPSISRNRERKCTENYNKRRNKFIFKTAIGSLVISNHNGSRVLFYKTASEYLFEKYIYILALEMSSPVNQHCASCIGTLSFPIRITRVSILTEGVLRRRGKNG